MAAKTEERRLLDRDAQWAAAAEQCDVERILEFFTADAVMYPPGMPVVAGKVALRTYVQSSLSIPGFRVSWNSSEARISSDGELAYLFGRNSVTAPDLTGQLQTIHGRGVTIWRREADGQWRCAVDIWNADVP